MKTAKIVIRGRLPGLNEYSDAERTNPRGAAQMKRTAQTAIEWIEKVQLKGVKFTRPVHMSYLWVEKDRRRDKSNIAFAKKFIEDALINAGVLKNDGWKEIEGFDDSFAVDKRNPRVEVTITEVEYA